MDTTTAVAATPTISASKEDRRLQKEEQAKERKRLNEIEKCENRIAEIDTLLSEIDDELSDPEVYTNVDRLTELSAKRTALENEQNELYERLKKSKKYKEIKDSISAEEKKLIDTFNKDQAKYYDIIWGKQGEWEAFYLEEGYVKGFKDANKLRDESLR